MPRENVTFRVEPKLWKDFKIFCINQNVGVSDELETLLQKRIKGAKA